MCIEGLKLQGELRKSEVGKVQPARPFRAGREHLEKFETPNVNRAPKTIFLFLLQFRAKKDICVRDDLLFFFWFSLEYEWKIGHPRT